MMKSFKKEFYFIFVVFLVLMIFSSPLWANEEISDNVTLENLQIDEVYEIGDGDKVYEDNGEMGSYSDLNDLITNNNVIELDKDYKYNSSIDSNLKDGIQIKKSVVIDGNGFTINSTNEAKLFDIKSKGDLTLKNIVLLNYNPASASAINNIGKLTFDNVTFTTQKEVSTGTIQAAIVNDGTFNVKNSNFADSLINCSGNGILYVYGLLIKNSKNLIIENTNMTNNGVLAKAGTVQIHGGMIHNSGKLSLDNVNMSDSFSNVKASVSMVFGFILGTNDKSEILVNNSCFENNLIVNDARTNSALANVIRVTNGDLKVYNSKFINNTGSLNAGAIGYYAQNEMILENSLFDSNSVTIQGGAIFLSGNLKSNNNTFRNNFAGRNGGAIYVYGYYDAGNPDLGNVVSTNDVFEYNYVESSPDEYGQASILSWGGAICSKAGNLNLLNDTFYRNKALMGDGGAIANYLSSNLQVSHCIFKENEATRWEVWTHASGLGGAILIPQTEMVDEDNYAIFNIEYSIFDNNKGIAGLALYSVPYQDVPCDFISNNNYWGSNNPFFKELIGKYQLSDVVFPDNFIVMDIECNDSVYIGSSNTFKVTLNKINENGQIMDLEDVLPDYEFSIASVLNSLSNDTIIIRNGEASFVYDAVNYGVETFSINYRYFKKLISVVKYDSKMEFNYTNSIDGALFNVFVADDLVGNISIKFNDAIFSARVNDGVATIKLPKLSQGVNKISISYEGDEKYNSFSFDEDIELEKNIVNVEVLTTSDLSNSNVISIKFLIDATGRVLFDVDGKSFYSNVKNGVASLDISSLGEGIKNIAWNYLGDDNYYGMNGTFTVNIPAKPKITENKDVVSYYTDGSVYKVRILENNKPIGEGNSVAFTINGKKITVKTDKNGYASFKITQKPKKYTVTAQYKDIKVQNTITVKKVLLAKNISKKKAKRIKYTATVKGKKAFKGKKVTFKINGKTYSAKTNKKGVAKVYLKNLKVGKHKIVIKYANTKVTKTIRIKK